MYIHKHGVTYKRFFICANCKCEYSADDKECFIFQEEDFDGQLLTIKCDCPDCGFENTWNPNDILRATVTTEVHV